MKSLRLAYLRFRDELRARLTRSMYARFMRRRAKARAFLAMRVDTPARRWPTVNDCSNSVARCRRENGRTN